MKRLLLISLFVVGCTEQVDLADNNGRPFSLYGVLSPRADTQFVRVFAIREELRPIPPTPLEATFTSENLMTGETRAWQDSVIQYTDSTYGHVFWASFSVSYDQTYELTARRPEGQQSTVSVHLPAKAVAEAQEPYVNQVGRNAGAIWPILFAGETVHLLKPEVQYWVKYEGFSDTVTRITLPYADRSRSTEAGRLLPINVTQDYEKVEERLRKLNLYNPDCGIMLLQIRLTVRVVNEEWSLPADVEDPRHLIQPGLFSNVKNGFGFVGGGYSEQGEWYPRQSFLDKTPFRHELDWFPDACPQPGPPFQVSKPVGPRSRPSGAAGEDHSIAALFLTFT